MIFKKKEKESKNKKEKKLPVMKVGTHKKFVDSAAYKRQLWRI